MNLPLTLQERIDLAYILARLQEVADSAPYSKLLPSEATLARDLLLKLSDHPEAQR